MLKKFNSYFIVILVNIIVIGFYTFINDNKTSETERAELLNYAEVVGDTVMHRLKSEIKNTTLKIDSLGTALDSIYSSFSILSDDSIKLRQELTKVFAQMKHVDGCFIAIERKGESYSEYVHKCSGELMFKHIEDSYNFVDTTSNYVWFTNTVKNTVPTWTGPYLAGAGNKRVITYCIPKTLRDGSSLVVGLDYSTISLYLLLNGWNSARIGLPYLLNREGNFIAHPDDECTTLDSLNDETLNKLWMSLKNGEPIHPTEYYHKNTISGKMCWEKVDKVGSPDWLLGFSITDQSIYRNSNYFNLTRRKKIRMSLFFFLSFLLLELLVLRFTHKRDKKLLQVSVFASCLSLSVILFCIYNYSIHFPKTFISKEDTTMQSDEENDKVPKWNHFMLLDHDRVNEFKAMYEDKVKSKDDAPLQHIPTGLYIKTIKFIDSYSAKLTGYIWQIYPDSVTERNCVIFPDAEDISTEALPTERIFLANETLAFLHRWYFSMEIREEFNYKVYPFDQSDLWIRMWSSDFHDNNVILTPDIESYTLFHPSYTPGIDNEIVIPGWNIEASYFTYKQKNYYTNFGHNMDCTKNKYPELHYNIQMQRDFRDPIISRIIPLLVLLLMTYSILYLSKEDDALNVAIACSGLLFIAVFEHINLRRTLDMPGIVLLEYFYFITYLLLMVVAVNINVERWIVKSFNRRLVTTDIIQQFYWLAILVILLLVSLFSFY